MKRLIFSACVAAVFTAGCNRQTQEPSAPSPVAIDLPKIQPMTSPVPSVESNEAVEIVASKVVAKIDVLSVGHEDRGSVDHLARARQMKEDGDWEGAMNECRRALKDEPMNEDALTMIGSIGRSMKKYDLAGAAYERLAELNADDALPLVQQARILVAQHDFEGASKVAREAIARDPENPEAFQVAGRAYLSAGELGQAIHFFKEVVEKNPSHGYAFNNLGFAYLRSGQNNEALEALTRASELLPEVAYVQNNLGVALERTAHIEEAKLAFARSTSLSPKYLKAQLNSERLSRVASAQTVPSVEDSEPDEPMPDEAQDNPADGVPDAH